VTRFANRIALVTGGAQGIGAATCARLAQEGAVVVVVDRDAERCRATLERVRDAGVYGRAYGCDVSVAAEVAALQARVVAEVGPVDVLVNNAGILRNDPLEALSDAAWHEVLDVNLSSMFYLCRAFAPSMRARRYGRIVNLSSRAALGNAGQANYAAAKAGVQGLTATLALELGPDGITVNAVAPGYIATAMTAALAHARGIEEDEQQAAVAARTPLRRVGQPEELAAVIAFLASDDASYVSGQTLYVNGGALTSG
jgi:3-oxoacyl-[acyl-carrier protein] reductase